MAVSTLAFAAISLATAGVAAYSSYQQGKAVKKQTAYNSQVERVNQVTIQQQTDSDLGRVREKYRRVRGSQKAASAASGLLSGGSFNDLAMDTNLQEDFDTLSLLYKSKVEITGSEQRRKLGIMQGKQAQKQAKLETVGSLLSSAGNMYGAYPTIKS